MLGRTMLEVGRVPRGNYGLPDPTEMIPWCVLGFCGRRGNRLLVSSATGDVVNNGCKLAFGRVLAQKVQNQQGSRRGAGDPLRRVHRPGRRLASKWGSFIFKAEKEPSDPSPGSEDFRLHSFCSFCSFCSESKRLRRLQSPQTPGNHTNNPPFLTVGWYWYNFIHDRHRHGLRISIAWCNISESGTNSQQTAPWDGPGRELWTVWLQGR